MIKWLSSKIMQWAREYDQQDETEAVYGVSTKSRRKGNGRNTIAIDSDRGPDIPRTFRFDVSVGRGGVVLITRRYDAKRDETIEILNVIHDDEDISTQIGQIVAMEMIKS